MYDYDEEFYLAKPGVEYIAGIDEAGRGPLAGPVCACAVILDRENHIEGLNDSKKLTPKRREALYDKIKTLAVAYSFGWASPEEIDEINILQATFLAMKRAVDGLSIPPDMLLIDGNLDPEIGVDTITIVKGDSLSACISAASIMAKVERDRLITQLSLKYPEYGFEKHKGYGTKLHYQMLDEFGPCAIHRKSFLKKWEAARK